MARTTAVLKLSNSREILRIIRALKSGMNASVYRGGVRHFSLPLDEGPAEELLVSVDLTREALIRHCKVGRDKS